MIIEVDQSIKVENTTKDTAIGISDGKEHYAAVVSRQVKRKLQIGFRKAGKPRLFVYRTFVAAVVLTILKSKWKNISEVVIDIEYTGQEQRVRSILLEMWSRFSDDVPTISFRAIGKKAQAHYACYEVTRGIRKPDIVLTFGDIKRLALK